MLEIWISISGTRHGHGHVYKKKRKTMRSDEMKKYLTKGTVFTI